jgi:hypothetical protein
MLLMNSRKSDMIQPVLQANPESAYNDNGGINHCHCPAGFIGEQFQKFLAKFPQLWDFENFAISRVPRFDFRAFYETHIRGD